MLPWCDQFSQLCSESLDRTLTSQETVRLRFHLLSCENCRNLNVNFEFIRNILKNFDDNDEVGSDSINLSEMASNRIHQQLMKAMGEKEVYE